MAVVCCGVARGCGVEASAEILRLEAVRVAVVDELSLRPDDQVIASRGVGSWLAANTMLQVRDGKKIAALGAALRPFPAVAAGSIAGIARSIMPC